MKLRPDPDHVISRAICIIFLIAAVIQIAEGTTFYVGQGPGALPTVGEAVASALDGDTVIVSGGPFNENVYINHRISLIGRDTSGGMPILSAGGRGPGIIVAVPGCLIEGLIVQDAGDYDGIRIEAGGSTIKGCEVIRSGNGIALIGSGGNIIAGNTIHLSRRSGITLLQSNDNVIMRNVLSENQQSGLTVGQGTTGNHIYLNSFEDETNVYAGDAVSWSSTEAIAYSYGGASYSGRLGNYWINYSGSDTDGNGVGERPYTLEGAKGEGASKPSTQSRRDTFPLIKPVASYAITAGAFIDPTPTAPPQSTGTTIVTETTKIQTDTTTASSNATPEAENAGPLDMNAVFQLIAVCALATGGVAVALIWQRGTTARNRLPGGTTTTAPKSAANDGSTTILTGPGDAMAASFGSTTFFPPELQDKYQGIEYVGKGGIARIYRAIRKSDGQPVAIKIPINFDELTGISFMKEIKVWEGLRHPNIVEISGGNILPLPYFEMEYLPSSLDREVLPMSLCDAVRIVDGIAQGLAYAHKRGIVHRDLKPQNILLTASRVPKISDWGLSKVMADGKESKIGGYSPVYAAPEAISPKRFGPTDARTDIYQVGVIFYEMVTGQAPVTGESIDEIVSSILHDTPVSPSSLNPDAKAVEPIILKCLEKNPENRYRSADDLHHDLEAYIEICGNDPS